MMALRMGKGSVTLLINSGIRRSWNTNDVRLGVSGVIIRCASATGVYKAWTEQAVKTQGKTKNNGGFSTEDRHDQPTVMQDGSDGNDVTDDNLTGIASDIIAKASIKDVMINSVSIPTVKTYVKQLLLVGWTPELVKNVFISCPTYLTQSGQKTLKVVELLTVYGFSKEQSAAVMSSGVMTGRTEKSFSESISTLMKIGLKDQQLQGLVSFFPNVLLLDLMKVETRVMDLKSLFKTDDIVSLIFTSPNILLDDWELISDKFHYVFSVMGIKQRQMVSSRLFRYSLEYIMIRHRFVERAGFYTTPRDKDEHIRKTNPKLREILDTSDEHFANMFGGMTKQDYRAFYKLMKREMDSQVSKDHYYSDVSDSE